MKRKLSVLVNLCILTLFANAQKCINVEIPSSGEVSLTKEIKIPKINKGYTLWLPETQTPKGMLVFFNSRRDTINSEPIIDYSNKNGLAVLYLTTDNQVDFLFDKNAMLELEEFMDEVINTHKVPKDKLLFCGMSLAGTRAIKQAIFSSDSLSVKKIKPLAVVLCDSPLDMIRFHKEAVKAGKLAFNPLAANEGKWVSQYLEKNLGGKPKDQVYAYIDYSPYSYVAGPKNLYSLKDVAVRAYTEPDVNWWIENRRKDYYGMNSIDLAALVNELKIMGNKNAELVTTQNKGYHPDGRRHPHAWSIVDEKELVDWFLNLIG